MDSSQTGGRQRRFLGQHPGSPDACDPGSCDSISSRSCGKECKARAGWSAGSRWLPQRAAGHGDLSFAKEPAWRAYEAEAWRAASGAPVVYRWDADRAEASCHLGRGLFAAPCEPDEVAMLPPPPQWALTLVAFQPLPILVSEGWAEVHCYGP